ncbi:MAG: hypothetical protein VKM92_01790, partial [Cyanobacteriota bacterium]|nr:hypothetical protein [Cyanobacteriota bacterium]
APQRSPGTTRRTSTTEEERARSLRAMALRGWKRCRRGRTIHPLETMQKLHKEAHPVELAVIVALAVVEAITVLLVALLAVVLTLADRRPTAPEPAPGPAEPAPAAPLQHPLALVAEALVAELEGHTVAQLRTMARQAGLPRVLSRSGRRADLLQALAAWEVAACV